MSRRALRVFALLVVLGLGAAPAGAQWVSPQSDKDLRLTWNSERMGPSRVLILGGIQNLSRQPASRVVLKAEGLDESGEIVSRARGAGPGGVPPHGAPHLAL